MTGSSPRSRSASSRPCAAEQEDLAALRHLPSQQPGGGLGAGDDILVMGVDAELAQVLPHGRGRARGVVGDEGEVHAARLRLVQRLGGTHDRVLPDVDDTVEVEHGHVVRRGQRRLARPEHRHLPASSDFSSSAARSAASVMRSPSTASVRWNQVSASCGTTCLDERVGVRVAQPRHPGLARLGVQVRGLQGPQRGVELPAVAAGAGLDDGELGEQGRRELLPRRVATSASARSGRPSARSQSAMIAT